MMRLAAMVPSASNITLPWASEKMAWPVPVIVCRSSDSRTRMRTSAVPLEAKVDGRR